MDALDPENELIEKYLLGNLQGRELESFLKNLENDPILKKDVEFRLLLVSGIKDKGALELKNFIRSRTTQKRVMKVSFKAWYYAAAALAVILLAAVALLMNRPGTALAPTEIASNQQDHLPAQDKIAQSPSDVPTISENNSLPPVIESNPQAAEEEGFYGTKTEGTAEMTAEDYPESIIIASNIPVIPIKIQSALDEVAVMDRVKVKPTAGKIDTRKPASNMDKDGVADNGYSTVDSALAKQKSQVATMNTTTANFKLSFINTKDAIPQISINKNAQNNLNAADLVVYNLPYDNPLIFNLDNRYYLKTGKNYYEINMGKTGKQTVTPVTDTAVLAALEN